MDEEIKTPEEGVEEVVVPAEVAGEEAETEEVAAPDEAPETAEEEEAA